MKKGIFGLWAILALAFMLFLFISSFDTIKLGSVELKNSGMLAALTESSEPAEAPVPAPKPKPKPTVVDNKPKTILFIGDSMLEGLSPRLAAYAKENGHKLYTVIWYSSTSKIWSDASKLSYYKKQFNPDYIFICLGSNELFVKDIITKRRDCVKKIIAEIGNVPYVWIGPPNWKKDTGINQLIAQYAGQGHYFKSDGMHFDRAKDGAHPTRSSAALWMDSVARWMPKHAAHPIKLNKPKMAKASATRVVALQPQR